MRYKYSVLFYIYFFTFAINFMAHADDYHVKVTGVDIANDGKTEGTAWGSITYAMTQDYHAGDTIHVHPGVYREQKINIKYKQRNNITVIAHGSVNITNNVQEFEDTNIDAWAVYDQSKHIYSSTNTHSGPAVSNEDQALLAFGYFEYNNVNYKLVPYTSWSSFTNASDTEGNYIGPGTFYDVEGIYGNQTPNTLYIRMASTEQMGWLGFNNIAQDPDNLKIHLTVDPPLFNIWKAKGVTLEGFRLENAVIRSGGDVISPPDNLTLRNMSIVGTSAAYGKRGITISHLADNTIIDGVYITDNFPEWIVWEDVKKLYDHDNNPDTAKVHYYSLQNTAINNGGANNFKVRGSYIKNAHDGLVVVSGGTDWEIHHNVFENIQDDSIQLGSYVARVNIHHNAFLNTGTSVSKHAMSNLAKNIDNPYPGEKYIHHNLIEANPRYWFRRSPTVDGTIGTFNTRGDSQGRKSIPAFGQHSFLNAGQYKDPRKIYNNTVIASNFIGAGRYGKNIQGVQSIFKHEIYNNIFSVVVPVGSNAVLEIAGDKSDPQNHSTLYDGNSYYFEGDQTIGKNLFHKAMLLGDPAMNSLADLQIASNHTWESNGAELSPNFNADRVPQNAAIDNVGVDISGKMVQSIDLSASPKPWPDVNDADYIGAFNRRYADTITILDPILKNSGFEKVLDYKGGWSPGLKGGTVSRDMSVVQGNSASTASIKIDRNDSTALSFVESDYWQPVLAGRIYQARVFTKGENITHESHGALMKFRFLNQDGSVTNGSQTVKQYGSFDWQELSASVKVPAKAVSMKVRLCLYNKGTVWFDNVQLFQSPNLMPNPSFENDVTSDYELGDFTQDSNETYVGKYSIYTSSTILNSTQTASTVRERIHVVPGKKLKTMVYTKYKDIVANNTEYPGLSIETRFYNSSGQILELSHLSEFLNGTQDWSLLKTEGVVPDNSVYAEVVFKLEGKGHVWFDHLHVFQEKYN